MDDTDMEYVLVYDVDASEFSVFSHSAMIVEHTESFQAWLAKVLKPLCDADPGALAKYVLALIKKDKTEKELRQSMIDQLDVFLQGETKQFVDKLFEALNTKEYLNAKCPDPVQPKNESVGDKGSDSSSSGKGEKPGSTTSETEPTSSTSGPTATVNSSNITSSGSDGSAKKGINTLSVTPSALLNAGSTEVTNPHNDSSGNKDDSKSRRDRRDDDRDKRRKRSRTDRDRRGSRSRSADRTKRSRSPRLERDRERDRDRNDRLRHRPRKSPPPRRYERDVWDRRRSRSPIRNRSASPRNRSRTPPRYRRPFNSSRSRSRSPIARDRSRSRSRSRSPVNKDKKDSLLPLPLVHSDPDLAIKDIAEKPLVQSVVVRPGAPQSEGTDLKPGYNAVPQASGVSGNRCRDFDEKGLCMRGELCPFDHGKDPVVLEDVVVPGIGSGGAPGYGARGIVPGGPGYNPPLVRPAIMGEYYPDSPSIEPPVGWGPGAPPFRPRHLGFDSVARGRGGLLLRPSAMGPYPVPGQRQLISVPVVGVPPAVPVMGDLRGPHPPMPPMQMHPMRGVHGMRGRGRGGFDHGRLGAKPPRNYTNCSLEVRKIPREQNTIMDLNSHFLRFGKIINIQINYDNDAEAALVTFSSPNEAQLAYRSTEAVLNNRFIRVFWHNKEKENEEDSEVQNPPRIPVKERLGAQQEPSDDRRHEHEKILISGNNLTKTVYNNAFLAKKLETPQEKLQAVEAIKKSQELLAAQENLKKLQEAKKQEVLKMSNDLRKRKQTMMEEQIEQQKKLIAKFEVSKDNMKPEEKQALLRLIKSLQENVEKLKKDLDESNPKVMKKASFTSPKTKEEAQKEMLDAELDLYNKEQEGGDTIDLQKKVLQLRAHAKSLGLLGGRGRGAYRGAGRGFRPRGIIRGRGRLRALRSVDRRPTKLRVTGFPSVKLPDLLQHFSLFGNIRDYESDGTIPMMIVNFDSRKCAEVAMSNGQMFEDTKLTMEWVTENNAENKAGPVDNSNNGETSNHDDLDNSASIDEDEDELGDILNSEILLTGEEDEEDDEDRSWRR